MDKKQRRFLEEMVRLRGEERRQMQMLNSHRMFNGPLSNFGAYTPFQFTPNLSDAPEPEGDELRDLLNAQRQEGAKPLP